MVIDGVPPGIAIKEDDLINELSRRSSGKPGTTPRRESDIPEIISGVFRGFTTGAPLVMLTKNRDVKSEDYYHVRTIPRPGHADFTSGVKYGGFADYRGSGHFSGRITWGLVAAGYIAKRVIDPALVKANIISAGGLKDIDEAISAAEKENDTIGGVIECEVTGLYSGIGEPFFLSVESAISSLIFSVPAIKGIEFGSGFRAAAMKGSEHNDPIINSVGETETNNAGGINGGITNGNPVVFRVAVKPASSTGVEQRSLNIKTAKIESFTVEGRHDRLIALRIPVIIEAVTAIALADLIMIDRGIHFKSRRER